MLLNPLLATALSSVPLASGERAPATKDGAGTSSLEGGSPALFTWADVDGDGDLDLASVTADGRLRLLASDGGRFEDVTEVAGLAGIANAALALWGDYDGDRRMDLFVGAREGPSQLFENEGGVFGDRTAGSGLLVEGAVQSARWLDHDGDGRLDLFVVAADGNQLSVRLFRGLEGGIFAAAELPMLGAASARSLPDGRLGPTESGPRSSPAGTTGDEDGAGDHATEGTSLAGHAHGPRSPVPLAPTILPPATGPATLLGFPIACAISIKNQASPGSCLQASTTPTLGLLYPLSTNLFVAVGGDVGIGTTSPAAKLDVAGTTRITDTLTLAPPGDTALDVSSGSIYKAGTRFIHTRGGPVNTGMGLNALTSVTTGGENTASGNGSLFSNTTGSGNTACGVLALALSTIGNNNTAHGMRALFNTTSGARNVASGTRALYANTTGTNNSANGYAALRANTSGTANTASGYRALASNTTGIGNTATGAQALSTNTIGTLNTALGNGALTSNTTGLDNTASGANALRRNTTGSNNTASGSVALYFNTTGYRNTAVGYRALYTNTTGYQNTATGSSALEVSTGAYGNTATGYRALRNLNSGDRNIAIGHLAGSGLSNGSDNIFVGNTGGPFDGGTIRIGGTSHSRTHIAGIRGVTTGVANAIPVLVDSLGQLGTVSSSARFKEEIRDMGGSTERLLDLRPVVFRYKPEIQRGERPLEYGLIAEEVAEIFPELVVYDEEGQPFTVKYHLLSSMLLNELQKLSAANERELTELRERLSALEERCVASAALKDRPLVLPTLSSLEKQP